MDAREEFLLAMYTEAWRNIERHILVVWHSAGVVGATLALFALVEKEIIPLHIAITVECIVLAWLYAHVVDAEFWFRRNIHIISNIERQFLRASDETEIHYYFRTRLVGSQPPRLEHLRIQALLAIGLYLMLLTWYVFQIVQHHEPQELSAVPFIATFVAFVWLRRFRTNQTNKQRELERRSPGKPT